ncbi:hypothetical protein QNK06_15120 [Bacillus subtilis]|nr:hypothetical protein [Bacillus subtilis]KIN49138.1 hypothetical protein B4073_4286 [Bacillus subtilis]MCY8983556.1 hypothetical protein [Bacillus subtilis]OAY90099.1 hypothetical protein AWM78_01615 [Bacillus subtilis subsp. subtilis]QAW34110.1 hypothetical protein ETK61_15385 [Bacillus subtilis]QYX71068.1 hypothetical protein K3G18_14275 [Bacillus subtilis]
MSKFGKQKKVTIKGIEYTLQHPGTKRMVEIQDEAVNLNLGKPNSAAMYELFMKEVVVQPKVSFEYFDEHEGFMELMKEVQSFLIDETQTKAVLQKEGE